MSTRTYTVLPLSAVERRASRAQSKETPAAAPKSNRTARKRTSSWDPFEVWRTRVKSPSGSE